ncbi:MAG: 3-oxoacyl-ACP reductase FabG [Planctomycetota bacterium]|nr:MAG: 3-oxoacyl-ACP reductase FabG [Planctomycetota bacterium]
MDLTGKVALVTGSSRGIGAGIIRGLAAHGAICVVNYVADAAGRNLADAQSVAHDSGAGLVVEADVSNHARVGAAMEEITARLGGIDILVNNAGILRDRTIRKMTPDDFHAVVQVNLGGAFNTLQHATSLLRPGGRIVNIASVAGFMGFFGQANYASAKAGLVALTKVAAREFARQRITVNCVAPGFVETEIIKEMPAEVTARFLEQIPLGRIGRIEDVVNAVCFLCAPQSDYVTGQTIHVNGGFYM